MSGSDEVFFDVFVGTLLSSLVFIPILITIADGCQLTIFWKLMIYLVPSAIMIAIIVFDSIGIMTSAIYAIAWVIASIIVIKVTGSWEMFVLTLLIVAGVAYYKKVYKKEYRTTKSYIFVQSFKHP